MDTEQLGVMGIKIIWSLDKWKRKHSSIRIKMNAHKLHNHHKKFFLNLLTSTTVSTMFCEVVYHLVDPIITTFFILPYKMHDHQWQATSYHDGWLQSYHCTNKLITYLLLLAASHTPLPQKFHHWGHSGPTKGPVGFDPFCKFFC